jgi:hypothetical protein
MLRRPVGGRQDSQSEGARVNNELAGTTRRLRQEPALTAPRTDLRITRSAVENACVLTVRGVLGHLTYLPLRDAIVKAALDEPAAVVIEISDLRIHDDPALSVFTSARWQVSEWPDTPIGLVCTSAHRLKALRHKAVTRYVPAYPSLQSAIADLAADASRRYRQRVRAELPALKSSTVRSRELTTQWLTAWGRTDFITAVSVVATELVQMALAETDGPIALRLETDGSTIKVALQFSRAATVVRQKSRSDTVSELDLIAGSCRVWGSHIGAAGDTIWVVLGPENRF